MSSYPLLNLFLTMLWFFLWILWLMLLFRVIVDIFRDDELSGWGKAGWMIFVCVLPFLGIFVYLIARGRGMGERELRHAQAKEREFRAYVRGAAAEPAAGTSQVAELEKLAGLRNHGDITEEEYQRAKNRLLAV
ncbi:MAG TPA: SHOCT domain-containing protein [Amycolatopsis sp.]|uniref:SHOCT domain-containing protein n=1 Tax=Amycolatopsis sp. TaxID=37632 RepID=UPI002B467DAC|nr:SHOCT domain-containing protein [Amycolatopsis sp.]HKS49658.1 SHOCT domain-containing protein [Amycolatopsis sp.]